MFQIALVPISLSSNKLDEPLMVDKSDTFKDKNK